MSNFVEGHKGKSIWPVIKLEELVVKVGSGITPKGGEKAYVKSGVPLIRSQNVLWGELDLSEVAYIAHVQHEKMSGSIVRPDDVLLNITGASIGRACVVPKSVVEANVNQHVCIIRVNRRLDSSYLKFFLLSGQGQSQIDKFQAGGNRQGLNFQQIKSFKLHLPPLPEQRKIAKILSTWDKAIAATEALIAASEEQKRGLMQELLTGKRRFGGFEGAWRTIRLSKIADVIMGSSPKSEFYNERKQGLPLLQGNADIKDRLSSPRVFTTQIIRECLPGDVLLSVRAPVGAIALSRHHACIGRGIAAIRAKKELSQDYIYQWLLNYEVKWESISQGSTFESVNSNDVKGLVIMLPSLPEQQKIAEVLSAADREIELLREKLGYLQEEKKGLMQVLLTGKRRVVVDEEEAVSV